MPMLRNLLLLAIATAGTAAQAGTVSGKFELDGKPTTPSEVAAFRMRDQFAPRTLETYVMLTLKPVDRAAIRSAIDPYTVAINDAAVRDDDYLALSIAADGVVGLNAHVGGTQYIDSSGRIMGQKGGLVASCKENAATRIACTVKSAKPVKTMDGQSWTLDVAFESDIDARTPGKPLAADGGEAGKALLALVSAVQGKDLASILAALSPAQAKDYQVDWRTPEENLKSAKDMLGMLLPKQPTITGGEQLDDDHVVLEVEGVPYANGRMLYLVEMVRTEGRWGYASASTAGMLR